jgi:hypothetical protein
MRKYKTIKVKNYELINITCDKCKKVIENDMELQEAYTIRFTGGFTSVFGDMNEVNCDLCQQCLYELIGEFCTYK